MQVAKAAGTVKRRIDDYLKLAGRIQNHHDADTIHDFRVASRNLMVIAHLISGEPHPVWYKKVAEWLKRLNRLRDLQVLKERVEGHEAIAVMIQTQIKHELQQWKEESPKVAPEQFGLYLKKECERAAHLIELSPERFDSAVRQHAKAVIDKLIARLGKVDISQPKTLHRLRIAYKSFRYTATFLHDAGVLPELSREKLKRWQELLGEIQDDEVASAWLREHWPEERALIRTIQLRSERLREQFSVEQPQFRQFVTGLFETLQPLL